MLKVEPKQGILDIALYEAGSAPKAEERNVIKLSSNENPYGQVRNPSMQLQGMRLKYIYILQLII